MTDEELQAIRRRLDFAREGMDAAGFWAGICDVGLDLLDEVRRLRVLTDRGRGRDDDNVDS